MFQHAHATRALRQVVISLQFQRFNAYLPNMQPGFDEGRLRVTAEGYETPRWYDRTYDLLFSLEGLKSSYSSLTNQDFHFSLKSGRHVYLANGQREWTYNQSIIREQGGSRAAFQAFEMYYATGSLLYGRCRRYAFVNEETGFSSFSFLESILNTAYRDQIDVRMIIPPKHARFLELIIQLELWPKYEEWKQRVVELNERMAVAQGQKPFPVWDFTGFGELQSEALPGAGKTGVLAKWFWEDAHYRPELGTLVLNRVFEYEEDEVPEDFGYLLTSASVLPFLADVLAQRKRYARTFPDDVLEISLMVAQTRDQRLPAAECGSGSTQAATARLPGKVAAEKVRVGKEGGSRQRLIDPGRLQGEFLGWSR